MLTFKHTLFTAIITIIVGSCHIRAGSNHAEHPDQMLLAPPGSVGVDATSLKKEGLPPELHTLLSRLSEIKPSNDKDAIKEMLKLADEMLFSLKGFLAEARLTSVMIDRARETFEKNGMQPSGFSPRPNAARSGASRAGGAKEYLA